MPFGYAVSCVQFGYDAEIFDRPHGRGTAEEWQHEIFAVIRIDVAPNDTKGEVGGGNERGRPKVYRVCATVEVIEVGKSGVIWENPIKHKVKGDD